MRYEPNYNEQLSIVSHAIRFANSEPPKTNRQRWVIEQYSGLGVLPPRARYVIDNSGKVYARKGMQIVSVRNAVKSASFRVCKQWWTRLRAILDEVTLDATVIPDSMRPIAKAMTNDGKIAVDNVTRQFWQGYFVHGYRVEKTTQNIVVPTIHTFVEIAGTLVAEKRWRGRVSKCSQCQQYFLAPKRKGGRRPLTCGKECATKRGDPTRNRRQREFRQRQRDSII